MPENRLLLFITQHKEKSIHGSLPLDRKLNQECQPQLPQWFSAGCWEHLTGWCSLSIATWKPHLRELSGTFSHGELQLAALKEPASPPIDFHWMFWVPNSIMFARCLPISQYLPFYFGLKLINSLVQNWKYGYWRYFSRWLAMYPAGSANEACLQPSKTVSQTKQKEQQGLYKLITTDVLLQ